MNILSLSSLETEPSQYKMTRMHLEQVYLSNRHKNPNRYDRFKMQHASEGVSGILSIYRISVLFPRAHLVDPRSVQPPLY